MMMTGKELACEKTTIGLKFTEHPKHGSNAQSRNTSEK